MLPHPRPLASALLIAALAPITGCTSSAPATPAQTDTRAVVAQQEQLNNQVRQELEQIPPPSKTRYLAVRSLTAWENPYITVQGGMVTLHVTLADANTSALGAGGMLRPAGARRQDLNIRSASSPPRSTPSPRAPGPTAASSPSKRPTKTPAGARPEVRRNMESAMQLAQRPRHRRLRVDRGRPRSHANRLHRNNLHATFDTA